MAAAPKQAWPADKIKRRKVAELVPYAKNARTHSDEQISQIAASIREWGFTNPVLIDEDSGIIAGHGRVLAAQLLGIKILPTMTATGWTDTQKRAYVLADNKLAQNADWDDDLLREELDGLKGLEFDLDIIGFDEGELEDLLSDGEPPKQVGALSERFLISPFSVLNAREGWWQDRKRGWLSMGFKSELGRDIDPTNVPKNPPAYMADRGNNEGGSIFDPVLCELIYTWFCPPGGVVLDPFAGGSVRGIVASATGRKYFGGELRGEQVEANRVQAKEICDDSVPVWEQGDSRGIDKIFPNVTADLLFSCPPYADLEVYSDDAADISNMDYEDFLKAYRTIIRKSCALLRPNSFACFVVGEIRDAKGNYRNFVGDTVEAFRAAGMNFYNEAILVTAVGSLPIRVTKQFKAGRKLGKTHQNVLIFVKGDGKKAADACGTVEVHVPNFGEGDLGEEL